MNRLNTPLIKRLVIKDWQLFEKQLAASVSGGIVALGLIGMARNWSFYLGSLLMIVVLVALACFSISNAMVNERRERTLPFAMSLPITPLEFYLSKLIGSALTFGVPLALLTIGTMLTILSTPLPDGLVLLALLVFGYIAFAFCFALSITMAVESEAWNIFAMVGSMLLVNPFIAGIGQIPAIADVFRGDAVIFGWQALAILAAQAVLSIAILIGTGWHHCRKSAFF